MPAFPGTAIVPLSPVDHERPHPSRSALEQQLGKKHPLASSAPTHGEVFTGDRDTAERCLDLFATDGTGPRR